MDEVRRDDDELCGHVELQDDSWIARVVFGAELGHHSTREDAVAQVLSEGLAALAERWTLRRDGAPDEVVCIVEANARSVTLALGYSSMPGVPTVTVAAADLVAGRWSMHRASRTDPAKGPVAANQVGGIHAEHAQRLRGKR